MPSPAASSALISQRFIEFGINLIAGEKNRIKCKFQRVVLFKSGDYLSYSSILRAADLGIPSPNPLLTRVEDREIERMVQSLACENSAESSKRKEVRRTDAFPLYCAFASSLYHLKINQIQLKETPQE